MHPEPARLLSAEAPSHRRPKTSFWQLHSAKGNSPWQQTTTPRRLSSGKQRKLFSPWPCALPRAMRGWAAPGSLGPAALPGVSGGRHSLPTGSPSLGSRIRGTMASCAQFPAMPLEPARRHSAEVQSHLRPKTSFWQLHSAKGNTPRAANYSPNACRIQKATQAVFAPAPPSP